MQTPETSKPRVLTFYNKETHPWNVSVFADTQSFSSFDEAFKVFMKNRGQLSLSVESCWSDPPFILTPRRIEIAEFKNTPSPVLKIQGDNTVMKMLEEMKPLSELKKEILKFLPQVENTSGGSKKEEPEMKSPPKKKTRYFKGRVVWGDIKNKISKDQQLSNIFRNYTFSFSFSSTDVLRPVPIKYSDYENSSLIEKGLFIQGFLHNLLRKNPWMTRITKENPDTTINLTVELLTEAQVPDWKGEILIDVEELPFPAFPSPFETLMDQHDRSLGIHHSEELEKTPKLANPHQVNSKSGDSKKEDPEAKSPPKKARDFKGWIVFDAAKDVIDKDQRLKNIFSEGFSYLIIDNIIDPALPMELEDCDDENFVAMAKFLSGSIRNLLENEVWVKYFIQENPDTIVNLTVKLLPKAEVGNWKEKGLCTIQEDCISSPPFPTPIEMLLNQHEYNYKGGVAHWKVLEPPPESKSPPKNTQHFKGWK